MIVTEIQMPRGVVLRIPSSWTFWQYDLYDFKRDAQGHIWRRFSGDGRSAWYRFDADALLQVVA